VQILYIELHSHNKASVELRYQKLHSQGYEKQILQVSEIEDAIASRTGYLCIYARSCGDWQEIVWLVGWGWALVESGCGGLSGGVVGFGDRQSCEVTAFALGGAARSRGIFDRSHFSNIIYLI